jgi:hypothetical protein
VRAIFSANDAPLSYFLMVAIRNIYWTQGMAAFIVCQLPRPDLPGSGGEFEGVSIRKANPFDDPAWFVNPVNVARVSKIGRDWQQA